MATLAFLSFLLATAAAQPAPAPKASTPALPPQAANPYPATAPLSPAAKSYPNMPTSWPDTDQRKGPISIDSLLKAPLVVEGMKLVTSKVDPNLLILPKSTQLVPGTAQVNYPGGAAGEATACHTPTCHRTTPTKDYNAEITTCQEANTWALTYDDGPTSPAQQTATGGAATVDLLTELTKMNLKVTMFVAGSNVYFNPDVLKSAFDAGHEIAIHTWNHPALTSLTNEQIVAEILYTEALIVSITGVKPRFFRPPFGDLDDRVRAIVAALGYENILWARDSGDFANPAGTVAEVKKWFVAQPGFIGLEHDIGATTNASLTVLREIQNTPNFPLKITTVGACIGKSAVANGTTPTSNTNSTAPAPTGTTPSTASAANKPTQSSEPNKSAAYLDKVLSSGVMALVVVVLAGFTLA